MRGVVFVFVVVVVVVLVLVLVACRGGIEGIGVGG